MYKLYTDIIITEGIMRDLIMDLSKDKVYLITKEFSNFIKSLEYEKNLSEKEQILVNELISNEIVFEIDEDEKKFFPNFEKNWDNPSKITNAVIEVSYNTINFFDTILRQLEKLLCLNYTFILVDDFSDSQLEYINKFIQSSSLVYFELIINYFENEQLINFIRSIESNKIKPNKLIIFNCKKGPKLQDKNIEYIINSKAYNYNSCGYIKPENFNLNYYLYTESLNYNTCLNRKLSIDTGGNIKNCPNMKKSFGNIKDTTLEEAIDKKGFKKYWSIKKDEISVCKDCEFRHICTDCRAFIENPKDLYSKPLKCGYDPYTGIWQEWSVNPLKQKAIKHYKLTV